MTSRSGRGRRERVIPAGGQARTELRQPATNRDRYHMPLPSAQTETRQGWRVCLTSKASWFSRSARLRVCLFASRDELEVMIAVGKVKSLPTG
jgi:hypothetical protein